MTADNIICNHDGLKDGGHIIHSPLCNEDQQPKQAKKAEPPQKQEDSKAITS